MVAATKVRRMLGVMLVLGVTVAAGYGAGCDDTAIPLPVAGCRETRCTCEEDPLQPTCKGFNARPEAGSTEEFDGGPGFDAARGDGSTVDAAGDASADAADAG